ncbi:MAG: zinc ABC transporter substrate-binding protein [Ekhidna sp.]|nr:zinc ABC transporter substrate-binding protein [Ekhidna sp.]
MNKAIIPFTLLLSFLVSCASSESTTNQTSKIVATTGMLYDAVVNIGGDSIEAEVIMGPGIDPHLYKATQGDLAKFKSADLIIYNGLHLEGKMGDILTRLGKQKPVLAAAEAVPVEFLISVSDYENAYDPHVWFDIKRWKYVVQAISRSLSQLDPENETYYKSNSETYLNELDSLHNYTLSRLLEIPKEQQILITAHDAFAYFGEAYDIKVRGIQGISTVADFGLKDIADLIDLIIDNNIKAIFVETSVSDKSINAVVVGCKEKGHNVEIGGYLYSDAMGQPGTPEGTYLGMLQKNVDTIVEALK